MDEQLIPVGGDPVADGVHPTVQTIFEANYPMEILLEPGRKLLTAAGGRTRRGPAGSP